MENSEDQQITKDVPDHRIFDWRWKLSISEELLPDKSDVEKQIRDLIIEDGMLPVYLDLCETQGWKKDDKLVQELKKKNEEELETLEGKLVDAQENLGDTEVHDILLQKAKFFCRIGSKDECIAAYDRAYEKTVGVGGRLDNIMTLVRLHILNNELLPADKQLQRAKKVLEAGGDWERRNKLKVYEGILLMIGRRFKEAAKLLLDCVATFTASELMPFPDFIFYTIIVSMVTLERNILRTKVVQSPEVIQVVQDQPAVRDLVQSFYHGDYNVFMASLLKVMELVKRDRYLSKHSRYIIRTVRFRAYQQFLEPFKTITLQAMADAFGVSVDLVECEVASFIASGKLNCKIDRVGGIIESNRPDAKNALYLQTIKEGDVVLNRIQKLSRVIDM